MDTCPGPRLWPSPGNGKADNIPDLVGRVAVVTGGNAGLGYQTALELARHGARVILACRSTDKGAAAAAAIRDEVPGSTVQVASLDLASLESVRRYGQPPAAGAPARSCGAGGDLPAPRAALVR